MREGGGGQSRMKIHGEIRLTWWGGEEKMCDGVERTKEGRSGEGQGGRWGGMEDSGRYLFQIQSSGQAASW